MLTIHPAWNITSIGQSLGVNLDWLGIVPTFLDCSDPRPAAVQFDSNYQHGGGWRPFQGFHLVGGDHAIQYGDDEPLVPLATATLRNERLFFYDGAWIAVFQPNNSFEVSRMD